MAEQPSVNLGHVFVEPVYQVQPLRGDPRGDIPPIGPAPMPTDQLQLLHPIEQAGDIRHLPNQSLPHFVPAQTL
jgi:hypothetical protein